MNRFKSNDKIDWTASSEFGTYSLCEQRRFRRACASAQSRQNLRCSLIQAVSQEEPSDRKPDPWPLWMAGHAQLKFVMTECSKTQIRLTGLILWLYTSRRKCSIVWTANYACLWLLSRLWWFSAQGDASELLSTIGRLLFSRHNDVTIPISILPTGRVSQFSNEVTDTRITEVLT